MVADGSVAAQVSEWGGVAVSSLRTAKVSPSYRQSRLHLPAGRFYLVGCFHPRLGHWPGLSLTHPKSQSRCLGKGRAFCHREFTPLATAAQVTALRHVRGGVLPSGAFPEPVTPSYGAPGVEFMGLHRENNAVVQISFLPGQVRGLSMPFLHLPEEAGVW